MIGLIIFLIVIGVCLYLIESYIPMSPPIMMVIRVLVVLFSVLLILNAFGIISGPMRPVFR